MTCEEYDEDYFYDNIDDVDYIIDYNGVDD